MESVDLIGTRLKQVQDLLDQGLAEVYTDLGLPGFRPRYAPVLKILDDDFLDDGGGRSIRELALSVGVTHSAMSQTVAQLLHDKLVTSTQGSDARKRLIRLTPAARKILPVLDTELRLTAVLARELEAEMTRPLSKALDEVLQLLAARPYRERVRAARLLAQQDSAQRSEAAQDS
ncbi:DNA-binding MarR family transcriptional regulator [Psychromicrobium silvestre]|uniref:DNA-binding MarR family transcriptional regulator n=1 Tax=Psychromicrobium silvestre TaxID=1645614 RepID=A0A7Y9S959_9MICC|nr:MarR family transcriptional regulator [Psychromicrobium silvestre]NYE96022.1 DNA-binding MarR family transcriptional regulator [Psychromicrobium silvestre]